MLHTHVPVIVQLGIAHRSYIAAINWVTGRFNVTFREEENGAKYYPPTGAATF